MGVLEGQDQASEPLAGNSECNLQPETLER